MTIALGVLIGLILALTGAGGAIMAVPLLVIVLGLGVAQAGPVALFAVGASATLGTITGLRASTVRYRAAALMASSGMLLAPLGVWLAHLLPALPLSLLFSAVLLGVALRMYRQARGGADEHLPELSSGTAPCQLNTETGRFRWTAPCARALIIAGAITGLLSGLLGVGGGFVLVPALRRTTDLPMNAIIATSLMTIALVASVSVLSAALAGHLQLALALPFAGGAIAGMLVGRGLAAHLAGPRLQQGFAIVSALVAIGMAAHSLLSA